MSLKTAKKGLIEMLKHLEKCTHVELKIIIVKSVFKYSARARAPLL